MVYFRHRSYLRNRGYTGGDRPLEDPPRRLQWTDENGTLPLFKCKKKSLRLFDDRHSIRCSGEISAAKNDISGAETRR